MFPLSWVSEEIKKSKRFWNAFVGDSITSTEWVHPNWREIVEYVLKDALVEYFDGNWKIPAWSVRCFNFGYDGAKTNDILEKVDDIRLVKADLVIYLMVRNNISKLTLTIHLSII